ncbi:MAG: ABC transporter substrate-binding protein [Candidatus Dormibacteraeota bacterium]|nr:ABC transporter substrate-binding protein [Candidatus Dormibacteraeota bacterium]
MKKVAYRALLAAVLGLSLMAAACGGGGSGSGNKGTVIIGSQNFAENVTLGYIYGGALADDGYTVQYKPNIGARSVLAPALESGTIDMYPGYSASELGFFSGSPGQETTSAQVNVQRLNTYLKKKNLEALHVSQAADENAFAVTKATSDKYHLTSLDQLQPHAGQLILGGPVDCPGRSDCLGGLQKVYGAHFKSYKVLDADGPLTHTALEQDEIQVAVVFSSDAIIQQQHWVILKDPKHISVADQVVPLINPKKIDSSGRSALNNVSSKLTTGQLVQLNAQVSVSQESSQQAAEGWLKHHGFSGKTT